MITFLQLVPKLGQIFAVVSSVFKVLRFSCSHCKDGFFFCFVFFRLHFSSSFSFSSVSEVEYCERKVKNVTKRIRFYRIYFMQFVLLFSQLCCHLDILFV